MVGATSAGLVVELGLLVAGDTGEAVAVAPHVAAVLRRWLANDMPVVTQDHAFDVLAGLGLVEVVKV